jgi:hypothetical protein
VVERATTRITIGASLNPDSASRTPTRRGRTRINRSTENTAAASVEDTIAASRNETCHDRSSR